MNITDVRVRKVAKEGKMSVYVSEKTSLCNCDHKCGRSDCSADTLLRAVKTKGASRSEYRTDERYMKISFPQQRNERVAMNMKRRCE